MKRDCPQGGGSSGGNGCFNCGESGYVHCTMFSSACAKILPRHQKRDCPNPPQGRTGGGGGGGNRECFNCYQTGHSKSDCPNERVMKCRNCNGIGHMSKECPEPKDWSRVKCTNCENFGHGAKRCPEPLKEESPGGDWGDNNGVAASGGWDDTANNDTANAGAGAASSGDWADDTTNAVDSWNNDCAGAGANTW